MTSRVGVQVALLAVVLVSVACLLPPQKLQSGGATGDDGEVDHNLLANGTFEGGRSVPWTTSFTAPGQGDGSVVEGAFCLRIDHPGQNRWDAQIRHREMVIQRGHQYRVRFKAWADKPTAARVKVGMSGPPYAEYWADSVQLGTEPRTFEAAFAMSGADDPTAELAFHVGGELAKHVPLSLCVDDVALVDPAYRRPVQREAEPVPQVLVNQAGYAPRLPKLAIVRDASLTPLAWTLRDEADQVVAQGDSAVHGQDLASGEHVHVVDFSSITKPGRYVLEVRGQRSAAFAIDADVFAPLTSDALAYFYFNRSGIDIRMPWAREPRWAHPAGHLSDKSVPCAPDAGCTYSRDVSGGWYDAGDYGKYVVNAGITVWTLLDLYERTAHLGTSLERFGDRKLALPEQGNGVPDLLDEVRYELEFLLKMQVPSGQPLAGMVHHKIHDKEWTALGLAPHESHMPRYLFAPSTAATLNVAATAAQAARIYREFDRAFAERCLQAAERAYRAAVQHPKMWAPKVTVGGGPYDDDELEDEWYWAAVELFITTGKPEYGERMRGSRHFPREPQVFGDVRSERESPTGMTWQHTQGLGTLSLAVVPSQLSARERETVRLSVVATAASYVELASHEGFRIPFATSTRGDYPWGSNSYLLNNMIVLGIAHDLTDDPRYLAALSAGMGYLLGANPLGRSYVTGYGTHPVEHPHHRFWAHQANAKYPAPPPGAVAGGPNTSLQDPYARAAGLTGCAPQKCYVDHIESWSTNEITINWNAPLAWTAAFLDEKAHAQP